MTDDSDVVLGHHDDRGTTQARRGAAMYDLIVVSWALGGVILLLDVLIPVLATVPLLVVWLVLVVTEWLLGATPGKLVTGVRVERLDGSRPGLHCAVLRRPWGWLLPLGMLGPVWEGVVLWVAIATILAMLVSVERSDDRRGFHDRWGGTRVITGDVHQRARLTVLLTTAILVLLTLVLASRATPVEVALGLS